MSFSANRSLWEAALSGSLSSVISALKRGAHLEYKTGIFEQTPLNVATHHYKWNVAELLLKRGADPNSADCDGETSLLKAAAAGNSEFICVILDAGAEIDLADEDGETPLIVAAKKGHVDSVKILLERGADVKKRNRWGKTALDGARECHKKDALKLLEEWNEK